MWYIEHEIKIYYTPPHPPPPNKKKQTNKKLQLSCREKILYMYWPYCLLFVFYTCTHFKTKCICNQEAKLWGHTLVLQSFCRYLFTKTDMFKINRSIIKNRSVQYNEQVKTSNFFSIMFELKVLVDICNI